MPSAQSPSPRGRVAAVALAALAGASSCRAGGEPDTRALGVACRPACAALVASGCDRDGSRPGDGAACIEHCRVRAPEAAQAGCSRERLRYLECAARQALDCSAACSAPLCLERAEGLPACSVEHATLARCLAPCLHAGVTSLVDRELGGARLLAEVVRAGCGSPPAPDRRAPEGSDCQAASVCSQVSCPCPTSRGQRLARVCVAGRCAGGDAACTLLRAGGRDGCE